MKISKIKIKDFHQFKDLTIDLTYPKGHEKEGRPLDKVCFIGQSGTGKTSLLELIPKFLTQYNTKFILQSGIRSISKKMSFSTEFGVGNEYTVDFEYRVNTEDGDKKSTGMTRVWTATKQNGQDVPWDQALAAYNSLIDSGVSSKVIYFPANLNFDLELDEHDALNEESSIIDFSVSKVASVWNLILAQIQEYQEQELQIRQEILRNVEEASDDFDSIKAALQRLEDWKKNKFNVIRDIADNCLDKLLKTFKLRVKTQLDIKSKDDIGFIKIEDYNGNEVPNGLWSTGTKQVVLSALPLYLLKPKNTVILFDEPERSLYPDLQRLVVDYYSSLTTNCQFFYASHSPIIASNFEPWEIVELKFNEEGHVYRELYYEGENHVDNYKWNPQHMRWDDILQRIFDMENDGSLIRKSKLDQLASTNVKYKKLISQDKENTDEARELLKTIQRLSEELSKWD